MTDENQYLIYGSNNSPYSIKARAYAIYKNIPHKWVLRGSDEEGYKKVAKLPLVPAIRIPGSGAGMQDSTPIMEYFDATFPNSVSTHPPTKTLRFLSELLEEFGDEWGNKWMFHYRWARPIDANMVAMRIVGEQMGDKATDEMLSKMSSMIRSRMTGRGFAVASNDITGPMIEQSFQDGCKMLEEHFKTRSFLFGERPSFGDFGLGLQVYQALIDPTAGRFLTENCPRVCVWCTKMVSPDTSLGHDDSKWETWDTLKGTLMPFLQTQVGDTFLAWSNANSIAISTKATECTVRLPKYGLWKNEVKGPQKYQHRSLGVLRQKFANARNDELDDIMKQTNCFNVLVGGGSKM